jgi:acyl dehydratase
MSVPDTEVELLEQSPSVGRLVARALATGARRPGAAGDLPTRRVVRTDVGVDVAELADYARVCGMTLRNEVPATYLHVLTFPLQVHLMAAADFPFAMAGMVHVGNEMTLHRPVDLGEQLTLSTHADSLRPHRRGLTVDLVGSAQAGGETVWQGRSTYLVRGAPAEGVVGEPEDDLVDVAGLPWRAQWRLPASLGRRYAAVAGDVNPIHLSPLAAKAFGFPRAIAHGMWTHARVLAALEGRLPARHTVRVHFRKPVLLPSTVELRAGRAETGWDFAVTGKDGAREHLLGTVREPDGTA